jgi:hypothetical protein
MIRSRICMFAVVLLVFAAFGCGGAMNLTPTGGANTSAVTLTVTDTPPSGVTILSFEVTVTGATLSPGNVQLVTNPVKIEVKQLETEAAFLSTVNVPQGTYSSIAVSFSGAEIAFLNQTGAAIGTCQNNSVCQIETSAASTVTYSGAPFPLAVMAGTSSGLQLDVNLANILSPTLGVNFSALNGLVVTQVATQPAGELEDLDDLDGSILSINAVNSQFTLHTLRGDFVIGTGSGTEFDFSACTANNFSCLQVGQAVEVDVKIMLGGVFTAKRIELDDQAADNEAEGVIFKIDDATHFEIVVLDELGSSSAVNPGNPIVVTLSASPSFQVQSDGLSAPSALQNAFQSATDTSQLLPGQEVQLRVKSASAGPPIAVTADRVRLRLSQLTANVSALASPNFSVGQLPALFTIAGVSSIHVQTSSKTDFDGVAGVTTLVNGDTVSLRGLLFKNGASAPELIAKKVRKR